MEIFTATRKRLKQEELGGMRRLSRHAVLEISSTLGAPMDTKKIERISKALADETRLQIFQAIAANSDLSCGDLVTLRGVTPATISHHLKILLDAELIACRKDGQFVRSRTVPETLEKYTAALGKLAVAGAAERKKKN